MPILTLPFSDCCALRHVDLAIPCFGLRYTSGSRWGHQFLFAAARSLPPNLETFTISCVHDAPLSGWTTTSDTFDRLEFELQAVPWHDIFRALNRLLTLREVTVCLRCGSEIPCEKWTDCYAAIVRQYSSALRSNFSFFL